MESRPESLIDVESLKQEARLRFGKYSAISSNTEIKRVQEEIEEFQLKSEEIEPEYKLPEFEGLEGDSDLAGLPQYLNEIFGEELLKSCLISRIVINGTEVNVFFSQQEDYVIPIGEYRSWVAENPSVKNFKVRAENYTNWVTGGHAGGYIPMPIQVFSFEGEVVDDKEYLQSLPEVERLKAFKIGTVVHEVGHHINQYLLTPEELVELEEVAGNSIALTDYAKKYKEGGYDKSRYTEEQFCEAVRLMATNPNYFKQVAPEFFDWVKQTLPEIKTYES